MSYVYHETYASKSNLTEFVVGYYRPNNAFVKESAFNTREGAQAQVSWLNGGERHSKVALAAPGSPPPREPTVFDCSGGVKG